MSLKALEIDLEICFAKHMLLDAMMKGAPVGFLGILGIHYMIANVFFSFSVILNTKYLVYFVFPSIKSSALCRKSFFHVCQ